MQVDLKSGRGLTHLFATGHHGMVQRIRDQITPIYLGEIVKNTNRLCLFQSPAASPYKSLTKRRCQGLIQQHVATDGAFCCRDVPRTPRI